ncbi:hypothetical protein HNR00_004841 [Methylorubrum rhodinum]|uniref:Uncharacterized protein n=1 Tax=Methylorubrum rhodinum TaxID=29428 RepID=A0A840ZSQ7_9HYPH|nr:hypothetical protein [Methylorubrum rhodinum]MBB5760098.1 hypothetical protein [Methylorubrum rhodinum]
MALSELHHVKGHDRRGGQMLDNPVQPSNVETDTPSDRQRRRTPSGPTFRQATEALLHEYEIITFGERNADYVEQKSARIRVHLLPFFGDKPLCEVASRPVQ